MTRPSTYLKRREKLAAHLEQLPRKEFDIEDCEKCVLAHGYKLFKLPELAPLRKYLGIGLYTDLCELYCNLVLGHTHVTTPKQAAKYIRQHLMGEEQ